MKYTVRFTVNCMCIFLPNWNVDIDLLLGFAHHLQSDVGKVFLRNLEIKKKCKIYTKAAATIPPPVTTGRPRSSSGRSLLLSSVRLIF